MKVNAFPSTSALDRKNKLWTCYVKLQAKMGRRACNFIPENYNLPAQKHQLMAKVGFQTDRTHDKDPPQKLLLPGPSLFTNDNDLSTIVMSTGFVWILPAQAD